MYLFRRDRENKIPLAYVRQRVSNTRKLHALCIIKKYQNKLVKMLDRSTIVAYC